MNAFKTDISVLILFFNRPDHLGKVFDEVKKARPARLFLYQDGPRGEHDVVGIEACRKLVADEQIDWECEVQRKYQEKNFGCDPSEYISQQWAFSQTDKCIVLEDDDVPSQSFFPFCKEMLDRYEHDSRITLISGLNTEADTLDTQGASYFFTRVFSIWGWASWSRVVLNEDGKYGFVHDSDQFELLKQKVAQYRQRKDMVQMCVDHANSGKEYYESIFWAYMLLHDGLAIIPSVNMINNIGMDGGTHFTSQLNLLPRRLRHVFTMPRKELAFPLTHPVQVVEHADYQRLHYLRNAWNNPCRKVQYSIEELLLNLRYGNFNAISKALRRRINKWLGKEKHF